jgi:2,3-diketo-5-methylthio-1-phosphopentane phosphatase
VEPLFIACDFDGTITQRDTLHVIVETFGEGGVWGSIEPRLRAGEITLEEAMERQFAEVRATPEEVRRTVLREAPLRPGFHEFLDWARDRGHRVAILSSGFRSVIEAVLAAGGVTGVPIHSHEARFSPEGCRLVWSDRGERCELCGRPCKRHDLAGHLRGERLVYVGDGISDRCAAKMADLVFARDGLAEHLAAEGHPYLPFEDFFEVRERLEPPAIRAA